MHWYLELVNVKGVFYSEQNIVFFYWKYYVDIVLWSPLICTEKAPCGSGYTGLRERIQF